MPIARRRLDPRSASVVDWPLTGQRSASKSLRIAERDEEVAGGGSSLEQAASGCTGDRHAAAAPARRRRLLALGPEQARKARVTG